MSEIINRVQESGLIPMDLADFKPKFEIVEIDIANQLWQGLILKEKDFRSWIKQNDWNSYEGKAVFIHCSADAIVPTWAYMLVASQLAAVSPAFIVGSKIDLEKELIKTEIAKINLAEFNDGIIIIKCC